MTRRERLAALARRGAALRLTEIEQELSELYRLAPELFAAAPSVNRRKRPRGRPRHELHVKPLKLKPPKTGADDRPPVH